MKNDISLNDQDGKIINMPVLKIGNYRWFICFLLFAATTINYLDEVEVYWLETGCLPVFPGNLAQPELF